MMSMPAIDESLLFRVEGVRNVTLDDIVDRKRELQLERACGMQLGEG